VRTGRRGKAANVAWILASPCELLCSAAIIECAVGHKVEDLIPEKKPYNVLLQQIFLFLYRQPRTTRRQLASDLLITPVFQLISSSILNRILDHLILTGYLTNDGEMIMPGPEAERVFYRSNGKDLYSVIRSGGEYRAVTPDGDVVGNLDARFVKSSGSGEISLGGRTWSMVKCDEGHNLVIVVPSGLPPAHTFWTGGEAAGFSPLICRQVQQIRAFGETSLPLGGHEREMVALALARLPADMGTDGLYIKEDPEKKSEVQIVSLHGSRFNRVLAILLRHLLENKVRVCYNDFLIHVTRLGKDTPSLRVAAAMRRIAGMTREEAGSLLPLPPYDSWKFARVLPEDLFRDMVISDHYHIEEFLELMQNTPVCLPNLPQHE
jgi:ATP-dependent Lhr-like helicase